MMAIDLLDALIAEMRTQGGVWTTGRVMGLPAPLGTTQRSIARWRLGALAARGQLLPVAGQHDREYRVNHAHAEQPVGRRRRHISHQRVVAVARKCPGMWLLAGSYSTHQSAKNMAKAAAAGKYKVYAPAGTFEARVEDVEDRTALYVRYRGGERR